MIKRKPYLLLLIFTVLLLIGYFITNTKSITILNIHDVYFVTLKRDILLFFIFIFGICFFIYLFLDLLKIQLSKKSIWIHISGIILASSLLFFLDYLSDRFETSHKSFEDYIHPPNFIFSPLKVTISKVEVESAGIQCRGKATKNTPSC